ncbi:hypothetical protein K502DRAFT_346574 [Neoconidiobolus thromboides FSU 785]|nr:hypothetical protein K502DRAFT_346574 [Neoconidiobolus thromboides FSU 785]
MGNCMACMGPKESSFNNQIVRNQHYEAIDAMDDLEFERLLQEDSMNRGNKVDRRYSSHSIKTLNQEEEEEVSVFQFEEEVQSNVELVKDEELQRLANLVDEQIKINKASDDNTPTFDNLKLELNLPNEGFSISNFDEEEEKEEEEDKVEENSEEDQETNNNLKLVDSNLEQSNSNENIVISPYKILQDIPSPEISITKLNQL